MPTDSTGTYTLPSGSVATGGDTALASQHNTPVADIADALTQRVMRNGSSPMIAPLRLVDGTRDKPAITFVSNTGIGFYKTPNGIGIAGTISGLFPVGLGPLPWSGRVAPPLWVLCNGQQLSRALHPDLWAFAQTEIAAGNTLYNNGDGFTTFGVADMRGRVIAGLDGGAGRLSFASTLGAAGGAQSITLNQVHLPNITLATTIWAGQGHHAHAYVSYERRQQIAPGGHYYAGDYDNRTTSGATLPEMYGSTPLGGSNAAFSLAQPTIAANFIIYAGA